jgi:hypothetical protein
MSADVGFVARQQTAFADVLCDQRRNRGDIIRGRWPNRDHVRR